MKYLPERTVLIITGAWNPAIVSPQWIAQHALGYEATKQFEVSLEFQVPDTSAPPRVSFESLSMVAETKRLMLFLSQKPEQQALSFSVAARTLNLLPHTPVNGLGVNFHYESSAPSAQLLGRFANADLVAFVDHEDAEVVKQENRISIKSNDHVINLVMKQGKTVEFSINMHFSCVNASDAAAVLEQAGLFDRLKAEVEALVLSCANEELENA